MIRRHLSSPFLLDSRVAAPSGGAHAGDLATPDPKSKRPALSLRSRTFVLLFLLVGLWIALLGCDWLVYQDLPDLIGAVAEGNEELRQFDTSCFSGEYVTGVEPTYLSELEFARSDEAKLQRRQAS